MSCAFKFALLFCFVVVTEYVSGSLIRDDGQKIKDVLGENVVEEVIKAHPIEISPETTEKKCAEIGSFCVNHSDCCSRSCLGYMRRCVS